MDDLIKLGKRRTILVSISILLVSLHTIYFYQAVRPEIEPAKLVQQSIRFLLTTGLLWMTYKGKDWAKIVSVVLFSFGMLGAVYGLTEMEGLMAIRIPFVVMIFVYSMAVFHFGISKSFKSFSQFQKLKTGS
jgi:hypothetical protein